MVHALSWRNTLTWDVCCGHIYLHCYFSVLVEVKAFCESFIDRLVGADQTGDKNFSNVIFYPLKLCFVVAVSVRQTTMGEES